LAKGPRYRVPYRRRREQKTDYKARRTLATSSDPRFVVRPTNRNMTIQIIRSEVKGDYTIVQTSSAELVRKFNWLGGRKSIPAAYLLGLIAGYKALNSGIEYTILDIGLKRPSKGSRVFAVVLGAQDAGLNVPCDREVVPVTEKIEGSTIANYAESLKVPMDTTEEEEINEYERMFSGYLRRGLKPETLPSHFKEIKTRIQEEFND
jgi:large subunit ribosomal protein L18